MRKQKLELKKLAVISLLFFSVIGALIAAFVIKTPTNSRSEATGCMDKPKMVLDSTDKYTTMTTYHLKLINNCGGNDKFTVNIKNLPNSPKRYDNWSWKFKNGDWNKPYTTDALSGTSDISLTIRMPLDNKGLPEKIQNGIYRFFEVETALSENSSLSDDLELIYSVEQ